MLKALVPQLGLNSGSGSGSGSAQTTPHVQAPGSGAATRAIQRLKPAKPRANTTTNTAKWSKYHFHAETYILQRFGCQKRSDFAQENAPRPAGGRGQTGPARGRRTPTLRTGADSHADEPLAKGRTRAGARTTTTATNSETRGCYFGAT